MNRLKWMMHKHWPLIIFGLFILIFSYLRIALVLRYLHELRVIADTSDYLRIAGLSPLSEKFLVGTRPFGYPFLLKVARGNLESAAIIQTMLSILCWSFLAWTVMRQMHSALIGLLGGFLVLALSLGRYVQIWDMVILSESMSLSLFVFVLSAGIALMEKWEWGRVLLFLGGAWAWAFTRDTNIWLILALSLIFIIAGIAGKRHWLGLGFALAAVFLVSSTIAERAERWVFPLQNVLAQRILTSPNHVNYFAACGMPITPELLDLAGGNASSKDRAFYDSPQLDTYRSWLQDHGKTCYLMWLIWDLPKTLVLPLEDWPRILSFAGIERFYTRSYIEIYPDWLDWIIYPRINPLAVVLALFLSVLASWFHPSLKRGPLWMAWAVMVLLFYPHLFLIWHADTLGLDRHAITLIVQYFLSIWIGLLLLIDRPQTPLNKPNWIQRILHQLVMLRPVTLFFASRLHRMDRFALRVTKGRFTLAQLAGWTIIQLTTVGAKTGKSRSMPLIATMDGEKIAVVASSFGREHNPGWYYNLKKHPECSVDHAGRSRSFVAREINGEEYDRYWQMAVSVYAGYESYKRSASHRHIPIMILEPKN